jgi:hypothetical protein
MKEQIDAGNEQEQTAHEPLDRDHAQNDSRAGRVRGCHRQS